ncbi:MAG: molybdate ABC transporter substrate-binding protein [Geminicoccaceae bacterium]
MRWHRRILLSLVAAAAWHPAMAADPIVLYAAGSLKAALTDVAKAYEDAYGAPVELEFAASGLLRERIEGGERADVFASANMAHPQALMAKGLGGPVALFARNRLCALAQPEIEVSTATLLDSMLDEEIRIGTSTPKADPSGDYAWQVFEKADALRPGAFAILDAKALQLTGGPDSAKPPEGRNTYGWVMAEDQADMFLTYCTNAVLARQEVAELQIVALPEELSVGADYGLLVRDGAPPDAWRLALFILAPEGQGILADYGFTSGALPREG